MEQFRDLHLPHLILKKRQLVLLWVAILVFPLLTYLHTRYGLVWTSHPIPLEMIQPYIDATGDHAFTVKLNTNRWMNQTPIFNSPARLLEDNTPLPHGNAGLKSIAGKGKGRYTLFNGQLIFSASDNTDPRANGHTYELYWPAPVNTTLAGILYFSATLGTALFLKLVHQYGLLPKFEQYEKSHVLQISLPFVLWTVIIFKEGWPISGKLNGIVSAIWLFLSVLLIFRQESKLFRIFRYPLTLLLFALPLSLLWKSGRFEYHAVVGLFPWSDAIGYYSDALRLEFGIPFSQLSSGRPLFPGLAAVLLVLTRHNLQLTLLLFCILNATAIFLLSEKIRLHFGALLSTLVLLLLFYDYSGYGFVGKLLTENLGLCLGALALTLLIGGAHENNPVLTGIGSFVLTIALNARAGAFFSLIALAIWSFFAYRRRGSRTFQTFFAVLIGQVAGFACNLLLLKIVGAPNAVPFFNFGSTLYGLASGYKKWTYVYSLYPTASGGEHFRLALDLIQQEPRLLLIGITRAYQDYFHPAGMFSFLYFYPGADQLIASWVLSALAAISLITLIQNRRQAIVSLLLSLLIGIVASVPFVPPIDDGIRAMTATIPISVLALAFALKQPGVSPTGENRPDRIDGYSRNLATAVIGLTVLGAIVVKSYGALPTETPTLTCRNGLVPVTMQVSRGSYVSIVEDDSIMFSFIPQLRRGDFEEALRKNYLFPDLGLILKNMRAGQSLLMGINRNDFQLIYLITRTDAIKNLNGLNYFCAQSTGFQNFYSDSLIESQ